MTLSYTEKIGKGKRVIELFVTEPAMMKAAGFDAEHIAKVLTEKVEATVAADARQEDLKRQLKGTTREVEALADDLYRTSSGYLDATIAAAGKGSDAANNIRRIRSRVRMPGEPAGTPTVQPLPEGPT